MVNAAPSQSSTLSERLLWILQIRGISQRELGRRAGLDPARVALIIHRERTTPGSTISVPTLKALAQGGGVSMGWLASGEGAPDPLENDSRASRQRLVAEAKSSIRELKAECKRVHTLVERLSRALKRE